jgi:hypothetical protein
MVGDHLHLLERQADGLADVLRFDLGECALIVLDPVGELEEGSCPLAYRCPRPVRECGVGGRHRAVDVRGCAVGDFGEHLPGGRGRHLIDRTVGRVGPAAVDEHLSVESHESLHNFIR